MRSFKLLAAVLAGVAQCFAQTSTTKPNIVLIFTDDQDLHLGSLDYMPILQKELIQQGTQFTNHYATVAQCCPSRASLFRGQAAHNTNITNVRHPGGDYQKWLKAGENDDHLGNWLVNAGYNAEYLGKFLNGYSRGNYMTKPTGWTHTDILVDPYVYSYNNVVMSANGATPVSYHGFHQLDVIRVKALDRIDQLAADGKPFYLTIAPSAPHVQGGDLPVPQTRYNGTANGLSAPRGGNWNPSEELQQGKASWVKLLAKMNQTVIDRVDEHFRARIDVLQGVDDIIQDVVEKLRNNSILDNTYIVYTTDNGYHLGNHRLAAGKQMPYREDTNLPLIVRGPGVPANATSKLPSAHYDFPPTFLEMAGVAKADFPVFLDGRSLLSSWKSANTSLPTCPLGGGDAHEIINVEFWGTGSIESPLQKPGPYGSNQTYKTLRVVGDDHSYLYSRWCTNETELYDTQSDPYELHNIANNTDDATKRLKSRLNALLLATKSCAEQTCRNPWKLLQPDSLGVVVEDASQLNISCLDQALQAKYDDFFNSIPHVSFQECKHVQLPAFEGPFLPADPGLGEAYREATDHYRDPVLPFPNPDHVRPNAVLQGGPAQRNVTLAGILARSKPLTECQLGTAACDGSGSD
ncbi:arylsulfatase [Xylariaceae sp. FL0804]|nr:arylsulfatase [Xylariaceae sp. FL0804]